jgi:hypothetical protein
MIANIWGYIRIGTSLPFICTMRPAHKYLSSYLCAMVDIALPGKERHSEICEEGRKGLRIFVSDHNMSVVKNSAQTCSMRDALHGQWV